MKTIHSNFRKIIAWTMIGIGTGFVGIPNAYALHEAIPSGFLCGVTNAPPVTVHVNGGYRILSKSVTTAGLPPNAEDFRQVRFATVVKSNLPNGSVAWTRPLAVTSLAVAKSFGGSNPGLFYPKVLPIARTVSSVFLFPGECGGSGVVPSGGNDYVWVAGGVASSEDTSVPTALLEDQPLNAGSIPPSKTQAVIKGRDLTVVNVWILNPANGNIVRLFKLRPKPGRILLPFTSGLFDIDSDGNTELVLVYVKFIGDVRYDYIYEYYNIFNGVLESTKTITQFHKLVILK